MGPPAVVVLGVDAERLVELASTEDEGPVEALGPDRLDHALGMGIRIRCSEGRADDLHPLRAEHRVERPTVLGVPTRVQATRYRRDHIGRWYLGGMSANRGF